MDEFLADVDLKVLLLKIGMLCGVLGAFWFCFVGIFVWRVFRKIRTLERENEQAFKDASRRIEENRLQVYKGIRRTNGQL